MSNEAAAAIIGALVGGGGGYVAAVFQAWQERRRRRKATATALLYELRLIDVVLREMFVLEHPANQSCGPSLPMHDRLLGELLLFKPATVETVLRAYGYMLDVRSRLDGFERGILKRGPHSDEELRWLCRAAILATPTAQKRLLAEGGVEPTTSFSEPLPPGEALPPSPFKS